MAYVMMRQHWWQYNGDDIEMQNNGRTTVAQIHDENDMPFN